MMQHMVTEVSRVPHGKPRSRGTGIKTMEGPPASRRQEWGWRKDEGFPAEESACTMAGRNDASGTFKGLWNHSPVFILVCHLAVRLVLHFRCYLLAPTATRGLTSSRSDIVIESMDSGAGLKCAIILALPKPICSTLREFCILPDLVSSSVKSGMMREPTSECHREN